MKKLKISVILVLAFIMVFSFVACDDGDGAEDKKTKVEIDTDDYADLIEGEWEARFNAKNFLKDAIVYATNEDFVDYLPLKKLSCTVKFLFDDDAGEAAFQIDTDDAREVLEDILPDAFEEYMDDIGEDAEDVYYEFVGGKLAFIEALCDAILDDMDVYDDGGYEVDGNKFYYEGEYMGKIEFIDEDTFVLSLTSDSEEMFGVDELTFERQ